MCTVLLFALIIITIAFAAAVFGLYQKNTNVLCKSRKRLDGKTILVTGGTSGIGLEVAKDVAARGARVIIACPFEQEGLLAHKTIVQTTGNENVVFKLLNFASLDSVRQFAKDILETEHRLDILFNNAGIGVSFQITSDGMPRIMQVNYFGHFLLTLLLLPLLKKTGTQSEPSRIVNTTSLLHRTAKMEFQDFNKMDFWSKCRGYGNSKISFILFSRELKKRLKNANIVMNNADPGAVGTTIFYSLGPIGRLITISYYYLSKNPWEGAQTLLHVALDSKAGEVNGEYFRDCKLRTAIPMAYDDDIAKKLWKESVRLVRLTDEEVEQCLQV